MLSSDRLRTFVAFAEDTNLSRAARRVHLSQPAVHAQLKALAAELGAPLYERVGRGLVLTREGIEVLAFARETNARTEELRSRLRPEGDGKRVVLAAGAGALVHLLAPGLRTFGRGRRTRVEVVAADAAQALALVRRGEAHVGVGVLPSTPADLEVTVLARAAQLVVVPRTHRLAKRRRIALSDLAGEDLVVPPEGGPQRAVLDALLASHGIEVHASATARGWDVVLKLAELGVGLGIVNATCTIPRTLRGIPVRELPVVSYVAFTRPRPPVHAAALVRAFVAL